MEIKFKKNIIPYIFIEPHFLGLFLFTLGPLIMSLIMSFFLTGR